MKLGILIVTLLLIWGCGESEREKEERYIDNLYTRITSQVYDGNGMSSSWYQIKDNIKAKKKVLYMVTSDEFSILVVRNSFNAVADTSINSSPDTAAITASPEVDKIANAIKNLENLSKKMSGQ